MAKPHRKTPRYEQEAEAAARAETVTRRIPADLSQQRPSNTYDPKLFYEDVPFTCQDCGSQEVWTAEQQKWWYEVAKGSIYSMAVRCRRCRQARRGGTAEEPETQEDVGNP